MEFGSLDFFAAGMLLKHGDVDEVGRRRREMGSHVSKAGESQRFVNSRP